MNQIRTLLQWAKNVDPKTHTKYLRVFVCKRLGKIDLWTSISLEHTDVIRLMLTKMDCNDYNKSTNFVLIFETKLKQE